jgi:HlyD family secretion protein
MLVAISKSKSRFLLLIFLSFIAGCKYHKTIVQGYAEAKYSYLSSAMSGNLMGLYVNKGDQVVVGQELFQLDLSPQTEQLEQAKQQHVQAKQSLLNLQTGQRDTIIAGIRAQLAQANANLEYTSKMLQRYQGLLNTHAIDKATVDQAGAAYKQSLQKVHEIKADLLEAEKGAREHLIVAQEAAVAASEALVKQAEWAVQQKTIKAPFAAEVFDTLYEPGEFVTAGHPVVVLLAVAKIKIIVFVPAKLLGDIKIGQEVVIKCDDCKSSYTAKISFIAPNAEYTPPVIFSVESRDKLVYRVEAKPDPRAALKLHPGQPVDVSI